ncbi:MAG: sugar phosphate isomerase/epimerase family protein [Chloroflexota bacterium]
MFLSMFNWMRKEPIDVTIRRLAKCGYQSIEILVDEPSKYNTREMRAILKEHNLFCVGAGSNMSEGRDLTHADEAVRASTVQYLKDCITLVEELDGHQMIIVPSQFGKMVPMASEEEEWAWCVEGLKEVYDHSQKAGVVIALEPLNRFESYFLNRHDQAILLAGEVGPNCGVCLDAFHINIEEVDRYQAILNTGDKLVAFHVAGNNRMACGQGDYDWVRLVTTLATAGYDGALTVEFIPPRDRTPANPYLNATSAIDLTQEELKLIQENASGVLSEEMYTWLVQLSADTLLNAIEKLGVPLSYNKKK